MKIEWAVSHKSKLTEFRNDLSIHMAAVNIHFNVIQMQMMTLDSRKNETLY